MRDEYTLDWSQSETFIVNAYCRFYTVIYDFNIILSLARIFY